MGGNEETIHSQSRQIGKISWLYYVAFYNWEILNGGRTQTNGFSFVIVFKYWHCLLIYLLQPPTQIISRVVDGQQFWILDRVWPFCIICFTNLESKSIWSHWQPWRSRICRLGKMSSSVRVLLIMAGSSHNSICSPTTELRLFASDRCVNLEHPLRNCVKWRTSSV